MYSGEYSAGYPGHPGPIGSHGDAHHAAHQTAHHGAQHGSHLGAQHGAQHGTHHGAHLGAQHGTHHGAHHGAHHQADHQGAHYGAHQAQGAAAPPPPQPNRQEQWRWEAPQMPQQDRAREWATHQHHLHQQQLQQRHPAASTHTPQRQLEPQPSAPPSRSTSSHRPERAEHQPAFEFKAPLQHAYQQVPSFTAKQHSAYPSSSSPYPSSSSPYPSSSSPYPSASSPYPSSSSPYAPPSSAYQLPPSHPPQPPARVHEYSQPLHSQYQPSNSHTTSHHPHHQAAPTPSAYHPQTPQPHQQQQPQSTSHLFQHLTLSTPSSHQPQRLQPQPSPYPQAYQRPASQPSIIQFNPQHSSAQFSSQRAASTAPAAPSVQYLPRVQQVQQQVQQVQQQVQQAQHHAYLPHPPRPHSVQPTSSATPSALRPQPTLTPHPSYLLHQQHHATCSCTSCTSCSPSTSTAPLEPAYAREPVRALQPLPRVDVTGSMGGLSRAAPPRRDREGPPAKRMRTDRVETASPVDLSVRTVRRSADSTAWHDADPEPEDCDSTAAPAPAPAPPPAPPPRLVPPRPAPRRTAVMPRVHFMPDFNVAHFYRREAPQPPPREREREDYHQQQVSLPGVSTLPWPPCTPQLLPRLSSNRGGSLHPSSSAPALPPALPPPSDYLLDALVVPAVPSSPAVPALPVAPRLPLPARAPVPTLPQGQEVPARIRTKAEMKMLGDAAAEAVRSWLAASSPHHSEPCESLCEASTSGLTASPADDIHLDSAEDIERQRALGYVENPVRDSVRDSVRDPIRDPAPCTVPCTAPCPAQTSAPTTIAAPAEGSAAPDASAPAVLLSSATVSALCEHDSVARVTRTSPSLAATVVETPRFEASSTPILEENEDSQGAWARSCLDFELQLGASSSRSPKKRFQRRNQIQATTTCERKTFNKAAEDNFSVSVDSSEAQDQRILCSTDSDRVASKIVSQVSPAKRKTRTKQGAFGDEASPHSSKGCHSFEEKALRSVQTRSSLSKFVLPHGSGIKSLENETEDKSSIHMRSSSLGREGKSKSQKQIKSKDLGSKGNSPGKSQVKQEIELPGEDHSSGKTIDQLFEDETLQYLTDSTTHSVKIRLRTKIVEVEKVQCLRPKGDGSDFRPGWEEEVFQYKRSLRMPQVLINMSKGIAYSEGDCSKSPSVYSASESAPDGSILKKTSRPSSEIDVSSHCPDIESEDAFSSTSLPTSVISRRSCVKQTIVDKLVEKVSRVSSKKKCDKIFKSSENGSGKSPKVLQSMDKPKTKQSSTINKDSRGSIKKSNTDLKISNRAEDSIKAVFGAEKNAVPPSKPKNQEESRREKSKSFPSKRKPERLPVRQISLRKRSLVIPKPTNKRSSSDTAHNDGIVLRPRNVQQGSSSRPGLRSVALVRRSKVVLNSKHRKVQKQSEGNTERKNPTLLEDIEQSPCCVVSPSKDALEPLTVVVRKRGRLRRKFRSGFDYIRKKKKVKKDNNKKTTVEMVSQVTERVPLTEEQIQVTLRNWVINRSHGDTVLHRAARLGYAEVAQYAIEKLNMSTRVADNAGYTPLHEAARRGHVDLCKILLEHGADVSCSATGGIRPLHEAAESNDVEMLRLLLEYGADPTLATYSNETALSIVEPDSPAHELLTLHLADVQGMPAPPWKFNGPSKIFDPVTYKGDLALQSPPSAELDSESELDVFSSEVIPPPLYTFYDEPQSQFWVLFKDLMKVLNIPSQDAMMSQLAGAANVISPSSQNDYPRIREITVEEFLQKTKSVTLSAPLSDLPTSESKICVVEYSCKVRALLNEEITTIHQ